MNKCEVDREQMKDDQQFLSTTDSEEAPLSKSTSFLYVLWSGNCAMPRSKVGYSINPHMRRAQLDQGSPFEVKLHWMWEVPANEVRFLEQEVHELLKNRRVRGEWFRIASHLAKEAVEQVLREHGLLKWPVMRNLDTGEVKEIRQRTFPLPK
jgi:hypothetical protein